MTLKSMEFFEDHDCDEDAEVDCDICQHCGEHAGFCSTCNLSNCCG